MIAKRETPNSGTSLAHQVAQKRGAVRNKTKKNGEKTKLIMKKTLTIIGLAVATLAGAQAQVLINNFSAYSENFNAMGNSTTATLPTGFRVNTTANWSTGTSATTQAAGTSGTGILTGTSSGGTYNFANGVTASSTDRSLGFLTSGSFSSPRTIAFAFTNSTGSTLTGLDLAWDYEKSRSGSRAFDWTFFHGATATAINTAAASGNQSYAADASNTVISNPPTSISKSFSLTGLSIADGTTYYLAWTYTGLLGATNAQALSIDNFSLTAVPEPSTWALIGIGSAFMLWNLRRKRSLKA